MNTIMNDMNAIDLDHAGVAGRDLDSLAAAYERLGFTLTPRARHSGRRKPDGPVEPFGTANRCIMLRQGYLELIAIVDPNCYSNGLERFLARHPGLHIIALSIGDEQQNLRRLAASGHRHSGRRLAGASGRRRRPERAARALRPAAAAGRAGGPHTVDSPSHPRGDLAAALPGSSPTMRSPWRKWCLPSRIRRNRRRVFRLLAGRPAVADAAGGYALNFERSRLRLLPAEALHAELPEVVIGSLPLIAAIAIRTDDGAAAIRRIVQGIAHRETARRAWWLHRKQPEERPSSSRNDRG